MLKVHYRNEKSLVCAVTAARIRRKLSTRSRAGSADGLQLPGPSLGIPRRRRAGPQRRVQHAEDALLVAGLQPELPHEVVRREGALRTVGQGLRGSPVER